MTNIWAEVNDIEQAKQLILAGYRDNHFFGPDVEFFPPPSPCRDVIDFGCGIGRNLKALIGRCTGTIYAYDHPNMLLMAMGQSETGTINRVRFMAPPIAVLPRNVDLIHATLVFQHLPAAGLDDALRLLSTKLTATGEMQVLSRGHTDEGLNVWEQINRFFYPLSPVDVFDATDHHQRVRWKPRFDWGWGRGLPWDDGIADEVYVHNAYRLGEFLKGKAFVDVGAHVGFVSRLALQYGASMVVACECHPDNASLLRKNLAGLSAKVIEHAVWSGTGEQVRILGFDSNPESNTGGSHVSENGFQVSTISLDDVLAKAEGDIGMLKMDCEGSEFPALYSSKLLPRCPRIAVEVHEGMGHAPNSTRHKLKAFLEAHGYGYGTELVDLSPDLSMLYAQK